MKYLLFISVIMVFISCNAEVNTQDQSEQNHNSVENTITSNLLQEFVNSDLSRLLLIHNSIQQGVNAVKNSSALFCELLERKETGREMVEILKQMNIAELNNLESFWYYECSQIICSQPEVINNMTNNEVDNYITLQSKLLDTIEKLAKTDPKWWSFPESSAALLFGLGNVMLKYEYKPFKELLGTNENVNGLMLSQMVKNENIPSIITNYITNFQKSKK